jgi:DNA invertase Pin-like site-specific DNA recombinase
MQRAIRSELKKMRLLLDMRGVFAKYETNLRRERELEGIAKAKAAGVYKGQPASIDAAQVRDFDGARLGATEIAKALKIGREFEHRPQFLPALSGGAAALSKWPAR